MLSNNKLISKTVQLKVGKLSQTAFRFSAVKFIPIVLYRKNNNWERKKDKEAIRVRKKEKEWVKER
jgi:hypothetical protein